VNKNLTEKELYKLMGSRLKRLRLEKGFSNYEHFAYEIGISRSLYGTYENGANLKISTLLKVLNGLDISFEEFFKNLKNEALMK
jgi:transcriptional regulator with XRE-family HTH domain